MNTEGAGNRCTSNTWFQHVSVYVEGLLLHSVSRFTLSNAVSARNYEVELIPPHFEALSAGFSFLSVPLLGAFLYPPSVTQKMTMAIWQPKNQQYGQTSRKDKEQRGT